MVSSAILIGACLVVQAQAEATGMMQNTSVASSTSGTFCDDSSCCKSKAKHHDDRKLCDEFYDSKMGVGYSMIRESRWSNLKIHFKSRAPTKEDVHWPPQQSISITHHGKRSCAYPGADSQWGLVFSIEQRSNFWEYFEQCHHKDNGPLAAQPHDGWKCGPDSRTPLSSTGWDYARFTKAKNEVVEETKGSAYNEFNSAGLSTSALAGIFVPECLHRKHKPSESQVCHALKKIVPSRKEWPVYDYEKKGEISSLHLSSYLNCGHSEAATAFV